MTFEQFEKFTTETPAWLFVFQREVSITEQERINKKLESFTSNWMSHQVKVEGEYQWLFNQAVLVAATTSVGGISGCSKDSLFRVFFELEEEMELFGLPRGELHLVKNKKITSFTRKELLNSLKSGEILADDMLLNQAISQVQDILTDNLLKKIEESSFNRYLVEK